jgi:formylmethanofuran dehydrogenase subunit C
VAQVILTLKATPGITIEAETITPEAFSGKGKEEIEKLLVWQGPKERPVADFFDVEIIGDGSQVETSIIIKGDVSRMKRIGQGRRSGTIRIEGSVGMHLGEEMAGGSIIVSGNAGPWAGMEMKGGLIHIQGDAGDHVGCAYRGSWRGMSGGRIIIDGNAKSQLGGGMSGGEIVVGGNVENFCGIRQNGGLILIHGNALRGVGAEMTGGTIAVKGRIGQFTPGFTPAGQEKDLHLGEHKLEGEFLKFMGDFAISKNPKGVLYAFQGTNQGL